MKKITQEDVDKAWEARAKALQDLATAEAKAWESQSGIWEKDWELERKFEEQEGDAD